jgi:hypothetical protein
LLKAEDFVLAFYDMIIVHKYGSYETCSSLHLSYPCACSAGFRRPSTDLSGETNAARPRPSDHYREQLTLNTTEERAKMTGVACGARSEVTQDLRAGLKQVKWGPHFLHKHTSKARELSVNCTVPLVALLLPFIFGAIPINYRARSLPLSNIQLVSFT